MLGNDVERVYSEVFVWKYLSLSVVKGWGIIDFVRISVRQKLIEIIENLSKILFFTKLTKLLEIIPTKSSLTFPTAIRNRQNFHANLISKLFQVSIQSILKIEFRLAAGSSFKKRKKQSCKSSYSSRTSFREKIMCAYW